MVTKMASMVNSKALHKISPTQCMFILSDFNARVGAGHASWPCQIGHQGVGDMNDNGQWVLGLCAEFDLCLTKTFVAANGRESHSISSLLWAQGPV